MAQPDITDKFLLRMRPKDTPTGVSIATVELLMNQTGLNKTELVHYALRQMADRYLPRYEQDDGPLTAAQHEAIRATSSASETPDELFTERLF